jgi:hypothetical protein
MLLKDVENHIMLLLGELEFQTQYVCNKQIIYWQRGRTIMTYYQEIREIVHACATDREETLELLDDIWYDVEATCPWGNPEKHRVGRLISNIIKAQKYVALSDSIFVDTIKSDSILWRHDLLQQPATASAFARIKAKIGRVFACFNAQNQYTLEASSMWSISMSNSYS